ncbi:MAG: acyl carrier protein [Candidatus Omnitrophota bacterium]
MKAKKDKPGKTAAIREDVKRLVADIARMDVGKIKESANIRDDLGVDSLAAMEILVSIEKRLGIVIDEAEAFDIVTVKDLIDLVTSIYTKKI